MRLDRNRLVAAAAACLLLNAPAAMAADIRIDQAWSRATPNGAGVAVGYLTIHNDAAGSDTLTGGSADFARAVEIHTMSMAGGAMTMREIAGGLDIPAHRTVTLSPRGEHVMFQGLKRPLRKGESLRVTLIFTHAGPIVVDFKVGGMADLRPGGGKPSVGGAMGGMKM